MFVDEPARSEVKCEELGLPRAVIAVIDRPEPVLLIDSDSEWRFHLRLRVFARKRLRRAVDPLQQLGPTRSALRMNRVEHAPVCGHCEVADRLRAGHHDFDGTLVESRGSAEVGIRFATSVPKVEDDGQRRGQDSEPEQQSQ